MGSNKLFVVIGVVAFVLQLTNAATINSCRCTREYVPICGSDGITYANKCVFECAKNQKDDLEINFIGECIGEVDMLFKSKPCSCDQIYKPVCGTDLKTYTNKCMLKCAARDSLVEVKHNGECGDQIEPFQLKDDACMCTRIYKPVCGTDGKTYSNECMLKCATRSSLVEKKHEGKCDDQIKTFQLKDNSCVCTRIYQPVCGTDGKTYSNECVLNCEAHITLVEKKHNGECGDQIKPFQFADEPCACFKNYKPVCGTDGKTYSNECMLKCAARNSLVEKKHEGECGDQIKPFELEDDACLCFKIYSPVCGTDGKTYSNQCVLECESRNSLVEKKHGGECGDQIQPIQFKNDACLCTRIYQPVCGTDGKTYSNECMLNCEAHITLVEKKHNGECGDQVKPFQVEDDSCVCFKNYEPVCGTDGKTYSNECMLKCAARNSVVEKKHEGECGDQIKPFQLMNDDLCICTEIFLPVCGTDDQTYSNECLLNCEKKNNQNLKVKSMGRCTSQKKVSAMEDAPICICTQEYAPVCGSDNKTYSNKCILKCDAKNNPALKIKSIGQCDLN